MFSTKFKLIPVALCILALASSSAHAEACRTSAEAEADAALRYQARLRVTALSCVAALPGQSLYTEYQSFAARNQDLLAGYQATLLQYYKKHGRGDAATKLHVRDTELNNEESVEAARGGSAFCRTHAVDLHRAASESQADVRQEIQGMESEQTATKGKCS